MTCRKKFKHGVEMSPQGSLEVGQEFRILIGGNAMRNSMQIYHLLEQQMIYMYYIICPLAGNKLSILENFPTTTMIKSALLCVHGSPSTKSIGNISRWMFRNREGSIEYSPLYSSVLTLSLVCLTKFDISLQNSIYLSSVGVNNTSHVA